MPAEVNPYESPHAVESPAALHSAFPWRRLNGVVSCLFVIIAMGLLMFILAREGNKSHSKGQIHKWPQPTIIYALPGLAGIIAISLTIVDTVRFSKSRYQMAKLLLALVCLQLLAVLWYWLIYTRIKPDAL